METVRIIRFYRRSQPYGCFGNFWLSEVKINGKIWPTTEHYYQAMKFYDESLQEKVRQAETPTMAAKIGRDPSNKMREDWEQVKDEFMRNAVWAKFIQHPDLQKELLGTTNALIVEDVGKDSYWARGINDQGINMLGIILMEVRNKLRNGLTHEYNEVQGYPEIITDSSLPQVPHMTHEMAAKAFEGLG